MSWASQGWNALVGDGQKTTYSNQQSVDDNTKKQLGGIWDAAQNAAKGGPGQLLTGAGQYATQMQQGGNLGMSALGGDPNAVSHLMSPYQQQVIDANNAQWQHTNAQTMNQTADAATKAGAFGGSRHGVAEGVALSNNNMAQQGQTANLLNAGYGQAMSQAGQLAGYGQQGAQMASNLGMGGVDNGMWQLNALRGGFIQPTGQTGSGDQKNQSQPGLLTGLGKIGGAIAPFFM